MDLPGYSPTYQGAWQGSRNAQQQQIGEGSAMWAQLMAQQQAAQAANQAHWQQLQQQTIRGLRGANTANLQDIADKYTAMSGQMSQQMIDRGLGNTTVQQSVQRGVAADRSKESTRSRNEFAQTIAGYRANIGTAGLNAESQGNALMAGLGKGQIDWLTGISIGYPNPQDYASSGYSGYGGGDPQRNTGLAGGVGAPYFQPFGSGYGAGGGGGMSSDMGGWATGYGGPSWNVAPSSGGGGGGGGGMDWGSADVAMADQGYGLG